MFKPISADDLKPGDNVVNIGKVHEVWRNGVFVTAEFTVTQWNTHKGTSVLVPKELTWHESEELFLTDEN